MMDKQSYAIVIMNIEHWTLNTEHKGSKSVYLFILPFKNIRDTQIHSHSIRNCFECVERGLKTIRDTWISFRFVSDRFPLLEMMIFFFFCFSFFFFFFCFIIIFGMEWNGINMECAHIIFFTTLKVDLLLTTIQTQTFAQISFFSIWFESKIWNMEKEREKMNSSYSISMGNMSYSFHK